MSRSRKVKCFTDYSRTYTSWSKRKASKKVRKALIVPNGGGFKRIYGSWDIKDYKTVYHEEKMNV